MLHRQRFRCPCRLPGGSLPRARSGCARALPGAPERFRVQFSHWSPFGTVAAAVFPSGGVERLAQLCAANGLILVRGVLTAITPRTKGRAALDTAAVTKDISATAPDEKDVYTFLPRTNPAAPLIVCGAHEWDLPPALRGEGG